MFLHVEEHMRGRDRRRTGRAIIELGDGEMVLVGEEPRPETELRRFDGRAVVVAGTLYVEPVVEVEEARPDPCPS